MEYYCTKGKTVLVVKTTAENIKLSRELRQSLRIGRQKVNLLVMSYIYEKTDVNCQRTRNLKCTAHIVTTENNNIKPIFCCFPNSRLSTQAAWASEGLLQHGVGVHYSLLVVWALCFCPMVLTSECCSVRIPHGAQRKHTLVLSAVG